MTSSRFLETSKNKTLQNIACYVVQEQQNLWLLKFPTIATLYYATVQNPFISFTTHVVSEMLPLAVCN